MRDREPGCRLVRHEANSSFGGHISDIALGDSLGMDRSVPEFAALHRSLDAEAADSATKSQGQAG